MRTDSQADCSRSLTRLLELNQVLSTGLSEAGHIRWLKGTWGKTESNRDARFYAITLAGRKALVKETTHWRRMSEVSGAAATRRNTSVKQVPLSSVGEAAERSTSRELMRILNARFAHNLLLLKRSFFGGGWPCRSTQAAHSSAEFGVDWQSHGTNAHSCGWQAPGHSDTPLFGRCAAQGPLR